jgi:leader peptidase (prepilin peptidase) / N-methyltransferase
MGLGDVKLVVPLALLLGATKLLVALFLAFILGAIVGIILIVFGRGKLKTAVPFGPFLISATIISLLFGDAIFSWYWTLIF